MKRSIPRSLLNATQAQKSDEATPVERMMPSTGAGSAWKSGALAQSNDALTTGRKKLADDILSGRHELALMPEQVTDPLGTDRRADWKRQDAFQTLVDSIAANGQDTPILVWPMDPTWKPDPLEPSQVDGVPFIMLTGRRRLAAAKQLGLPVRAILAPQDKRAGEEAGFEMLFLRFRENEERENLSAFERLVSIGELYESLAGTQEDGKLTATAFADRIGVHESLVSRARAVFKVRDEFLNAFKNAYDMSFRDIQAALGGLTKTKPTPVKKTKPAKLEVTRKIGSRKLSVASQANGLTVRAAGMKLDKDKLERLGDLIAEFLEQENNQAGRGES
ncbi:MAG: ParB N-terminal domain-containing protein [Natronospirillum sp.]